MKINKLSIILIIIIILLGSYILYDKVIKNNVNTNKEEEIKLIDEIKLDYANIILLSNGESYIIPIKPTEINKIEGNNLKERLNTLYERAFYFDIYLNEEKIKAFKVNINNISKIRLVNDNYVVFIKEDHRVGLFNYDEYYNLFYTNVIDNYNDYKDVLDIKDNKIIYLDKTSEDFKLEN